MPITMIPPNCSPDATFTERQIFEHIRNSELAEAYFFFHSIGIARHDRKEYSECDIVIVGPRGVYCLEVKGGAVSREGGVWKIGSGERSYTSTEGPFKQAEGGKWALLKWIEKSTLISRRDTVFGWGVAFPSIVFAEVDPSWDERIVYDLRDSQYSFHFYLRRLETYFAENLARIGRKVPPKLSPHKVSAVATALRRDFEVGLSLRGLVIEGRKETVELSRDQFRVLDFVLNPSNSRMLCSGGPGTGKTLVATEAAKRLADEGSKVLFLCFNSELAAAIAGQRCKDRAGYRMATVHEYMRELIVSAGLMASIPPGSDPSEYFATKYPDLFEEACEILIGTDELPQFDALVVDEAQDLLNDNTIDSLSLILSGGIENGRWAIFYDPSEQAQVYGRMDEGALAHLTETGAVTVELKDNYRNPKKVAEEAYAFTASTMPRCRRRLDSAVEYKIFADQRTAGAKLRALLVELLRDGISPPDVAVLSFRGSGKCLVDLYPPNVGKKVLSPRDAVAHGDAFQSCSISGFKGLEAEIVILTDIPGQLETDWQKSVFLVGVTRTRTKCIVLASGEFIKNRTELLLQRIEGEKDIS